MGSRSSDGESSFQEAHEDAASCENAARRSSGSTYRLRRSRNRFVTPHGRRVPRWRLLVDDGDCEMNIRRPRQKRRPSPRRRVRR